MKRKNNYQITRSPDSLVKFRKNSPYWKRNIRQNLKVDILNMDSRASKVRITYNKEFLPTRIEWYYKAKKASNGADFGAPIRIPSQK